jgi:hypothetical protein
MLILEAAMKLQQMPGSYMLARLIHAQHRSSVVYHRPAHVVGMAGHVAGISGHVGPEYPSSAAASSMRPSSRRRVRPRMPKANVTPKCIRPRRATSGPFACVGAAAGQPGEAETAARTADYHSRLPHCTARGRRGCQGRKRHSPPLVPALPALWVVTYPAPTSHSWMNRSNKAPSSGSNA